MARDLNQRSNTFVGLDQRLWLKLETGGYGRDATGGLFPIASDGLEHVNAMIEYNIPREDAAHRSGRSRVTRLSGKKEVKFSLETYIIPATPTGSNPNLPDIHPMLLSAFGSCDETDPAKKVYSLTRASADSFRFLEEGTHFSRLAIGCVADSVTFTLPGDGKAMVKFEGFGQDVISAGEARITEADTAVNTVEIPVGTGSRFEVGSYADVVLGTDGSTRTAASRKITAISPTTGPNGGDEVTLDGAAFNVAVDDYLIGAAPDFTADSAADALLGLKGSLTTGAFGTLDCDLLSAEITLKNNYTQKNMVYGTDSICGFIADKRREVSLKFDILLTKDNFDFYQRNKNFIADNVEIVLAPQEIPAPINAAAGRTFRFKFPKVEFNIPQIEQPGDSFVKLTLEGVALAQSVNSNNNEFTLEIGS
jgi:hypothetical protein